MIDPENAATAVQFGGRFGIDGSGNCGEGCGASAAGDWQVGDLVVWDNRPTMHRRLAFPDDQRRFMKRTQIFGDEVPV